MFELDMKSKPSFHEWDEAAYVLSKQLRLAARILSRKGLAERALQLRDQARIIDMIFLEADKNFEALNGRKRDPELVEAIENRAISKLMKIIPPLLESLPLLARQVAMASGSSLTEGVFKGAATEFFLGPAGKPQEGIGDGTFKH